MMLPSIFGENLLDDFFDDDWNAWGYSDTSLMNTDVKENEKDYELTMSMPGVQKDNVKAELNDGYLRRERYSGSCQRSFYVGKDVTEDDIKASFEDGTLKMTIPKKEAKPAVESKKQIAIEG